MPLQWHHLDTMASKNRRQVDSVEQLAQVNIKCTALLALYEGNPLVTSGSESSDSHLTTISFLQSHHSRKPNRLKYETNEYE